MKNTIEIGKNRTGIDLSPVDKQLLIEGAEESLPSTEGDETAIDQVRAEYLEEGASIGSMPPPGTVKGTAKAVVDMAKGTKATVFLDKLGERLAFERTGTRLYATLLGKFDASEVLPGGPKRADLEKIHREEMEHFEMLREVMLSLGADPTAITPSADVAAVSSMGLIQVLGDPRMNLKQSLEAILVAELVDNDCWTVLIELATAVGHPQIAKQFERAITEEREHLLNVRTWIKNATLGEAKPLSPPPKPARKT
jgi:rubrerythrin